MELRTAKMSFLILTQLIKYLSPQERLYYSLSLFLVYFLIIIFIEILYFYKNYNIKIPRFKFSILLINDFHKKIIIKNITIVQKWLLY